MIDDEKLAVDESRRLAQHEAVKDQIKQIVSGEPGDKPYSDQKIVEILRSQNVDIARRTVAKYREVLGILPSSKRKRYF